MSDADAHCSCCFHRCYAVSHRYLKPSLIHSKFFPGLQGPKGKMSSSIDSTAIFVTDTPKQIKKKVSRSSCFECTISRHVVCNGVSRVDRCNDASMLLYYL